MDVYSQESLLVASSMSLKRYLDERQKPKILENKQREISEEEITQYTDLEFGFVLNGKLLANDPSACIFIK